MSWTQKIKDFFTEDHDDDVEEKSLSPRYARRLTPGSEPEDEPEIPRVRQVKSWVKSGITSTPWLVFAIVLFAMFAQGAIALAALGYGLMKVAIAVILTLMADETMFRGQKDPYKASPWVPMTRRAMVFMGICWLMAVT